MSLIAGQAGTGDPPSGLSAFKTVGSQLAVSAGKKMFKSSTNMSFISRPIMITRYRCEINLLCHNMVVL